MKYYVISRYFDDGKVEAEIQLESEFNPDETKAGEFEHFDQYINDFPTIEEAEKFKEECFLA